MAHPYIKICGITREEDADAAIEAGAKALGFIAFEKSPRYINPRRFQEIKTYIKDRVPAVVVVVNPTDDLVKAYCDAGADIIQFHGQEPVAQIKACPTAAWKAWNIRNLADIETLKTYSGEVQRYLIDSFVKDATVPGGTGHLADWNLARQAVLQLDHPVLLAGGISPENILEAWLTVEPAGFDLSSSIEEMPGIKDPARLLQLKESLAQMGPSLV